MLEPLPSGTHYRSHVRDNQRVRRQMTASRLPDNDPDLAYASAVEAASESDRRWFERHPGETERWRPAGLGDGPRPGEPLLVTGRRWDGPQQMITCIHQIKPDVRVRRCFL